MNQRQGEGKTRMAEKGEQKGEACVGGLARKLRQRAMLR